MATTTSELPGNQPRRRRWPLIAAAVVIGLVAVLVGSALAPGGLFGGGSGSFSVRRLAGQVQSPDSLRTHESKVFDSSTPARLYGSQISRIEDQGFDSTGQMTSDLSPIPAAEFAAPVAAYKRYAAGWLRTVARDAGSLTATLRSGGRADAEAAWERAWSAYLHLGAVYGLFGDLDQAIDGNPGGLPGGTASSQFTGLHRIEMGLWTGRPLRTLVPYAARLERDVRRLEHVLPRTAIDPLNYATRAHEILEDAQRDLLSGMDVPWSGQGVLGTAAGLAATNEVIHTLVPLLNGRDNTLGEVQTELLYFGQALGRVRREHHGTWPTLGELTTSQRELVNGTLAGALSALELVPGTLETTPIERIPAIPGQR